MKQDSWRPSRRIERSFYEDLLATLRRYFAEHPVEGQGVGLLSASEWLDRYAWQAAQRMITGLLVGHARTWRGAARESMQGQMIYRALQQEMRGPVGRRVRELVKQNAELIRSLPLDVAQQVTAQVNREYQAGERFAAFEQLVPHTIRWKARLVARTETSKASTALTQARAENLGLGWYVWRTSEDARVRPAHRRMDGVLISWNEPPAPERLIGEKNPPAPYQAGNIYNCRCYPEPLVNIRNIRWPHKVYSDGRIQTMTLAAFRQINSSQLQEAA